ncbi:MAG: ribonuclease H-like domain-containing protein [Lachnospiraceae bacterium]|nr:ribonuclease H-like domain-containing protein [Lachnospiraceae bacterium]
MKTIKADFSINFPYFSVNDDDLSYLVFQMQTTGHYWRTTQITEFCIIHPTANEKWEELHLVSEIESDEYDMLLLFSEWLSECTHLIGYNSTSFHIPYLEQKYRAYGLESPFFGKKHTDLYQKYKTLGKRMLLSMKLEDMRTFLNIPETANDPGIILAVSSLSSFESFFSGNFTILDACCLEEELLFTLEAAIPFPVAYRYHHSCFYLICDESRAKIKIKTFGGRLRVYYQDCENYWYLPAEDMVIHKSLASSIDRSKRVKANPSNCYTYVTHTFSFPDDNKFFMKYIRTLLCNCFDL